MGFNVSSSTGALGRNRTCDLRFRKPLLYPLSYEGGDGAKCGAKLAATPASPLVRLVGRDRRRNNALKVCNSCLWPLTCQRKRLQGVNEPMLLSI